MSKRRGGCGGCLCGGGAPVHPVPSTSFAMNSAAATNVMAAPPKMSDDAMLAKELNELSVDERERVFHDIHGVTVNGEKETPEFTERILKEFDKEVELLSRTQKATLTRAKFLRPSIESDAKFKLIFLRADDYDAFKSARRMARYFDDKVNVFGEAKIVKKITMDDLEEEDMELFRSGPFMLLPQPDAVGRPIILTSVANFDFSSDLSLLRCCWYVIMKSLEREGIQEKGVCNIMHCPSGKEFSTPAPQILRTFMRDGRVLSNLPVRTACTHFCYDNPAMDFVLSAYRRAFGQKMRLRVSTHYGSNIEIQYKLMSYGIKLPFMLADTSAESCNNKQMEIHQQFIQEQLRLEEEEKRQQEQLYQDTINTNYRKNGTEGARLIIPYPRINDVLVGRGRPYQTYPGNVNLSDIVETQFLGRYNQLTDHFEITCLYMDVVKEIKEVYGGRFLHRTPEGWEVVKDEVARKKVSSCFRSKNPKNKPASNSKGKSSTGVGQKTRQPFMVPQPTASNSDGGIYQMALGGGSAKRPRYDPSVLVRGGR